MERYARKIAPLIRIRCAERNMKKRQLALLSIAACTAVLCGCGARETVVTPKFDAILYSDASLDDAMAFSEVPLEKRAQIKKSVKGVAADPTHLTVARGLLYAREQRDGKAFRALLHSESLDLLNQPSEEQMVYAMFQQVRTGEFLYAKENPKFFVTQGIPRERDLQSLFAESKAKPTATMTFYQYYHPKNMLIGTKFFLAEEGGTLKVFFPTRRMTAQQGT